MKEMILFIVIYLVPLPLFLVTFKLMRRIFGRDTNRLRNMPEHEKVLMGEADRLTVVYVSLTLLALANHPPPSELFGISTAYFAALIPVLLSETIFRWRRYRNRELQ